MRVAFLVLFIFTSISISYSQRRSAVLNVDTIKYQHAHTALHNYHLDGQDVLNIVYITNLKGKGSVEFKEADKLFIERLYFILNNQPNKIKVKLWVVQWALDDDAIKNKSYLNKDNSCPLAPIINLIALDGFVNIVPPDDNPTNRNYCYLDTCSVFFKSNSSVLRPILSGDKDGKGDKFYRCYKRIDNVQSLLEKLSLISELDRRKKTEDTLLNEIEYLTKVKDSLSQRDSGLILQLAKNNNPFSIGLDADVQFFQQATIQSEYNLDIDKVRSNFVGFSLLYSKPISSIKRLSFAEVKLGVQFGTAQFRLQNNSNIYTTVAARIPDADGDYYDRYISMNKITEEVSLSSNRMTLGMNYIFAGSRNSRLRYKIGFQVGTDLRTTVNYKISNGTWSYSAFYPQYNSFDTVFSSLYDFNKPGSSTEKSYTFQNSVNNLLVSFGGSAILGFKKVRMFSNIKTFNYRYNIVGGIYFNRWYQSFSAKDFNSSFPTYYYSKYNSFLFHADRIVLNQLSISLGLTYTL